MQRKAVRILPIEHLLSVDFVHNLSIRKRRVLVLALGRKTKKKTNNILIEGGVSYLQHSTYRINMP
jgi:hypothetical protein